MIPVLNKIDLESANPEVVKDQIVDLVGCKREDIIPASARSGLGVFDILRAIIERVPEPKGSPRSSRPRQCDPREWPASRPRRR